MNWFVFTLCVIAALLIAAGAMNEVSCEEGHIERRIQAKGVFDHFVCDKRKPGWLP